MNNNGQNKMKIIKKIKNVQKIIDSTAGTEIYYTCINSLLLKTRRFL
jgi:hypothetical protein